MKYYNPSNNFSAPLPREPKPYEPPRRNVTEVVVPQVPQAVIKENRKEDRSTVHKEAKRTPFAFFGGLDLDDILILGLLFILLINGCEDYLLLAILGYLFFTGRTS